MDKFFTVSNSGNFVRAFQRGRRALIMLGVVAILFNICLIFGMFLQRPVHSEETEIINAAMARARESMAAEWVSADAKFKHHPSSDIVIDRGELCSLYRLRVIVVAAESEKSKLSRLLTFLATANYSKRCLPIDVEVHVLGKLSGLPPLQWVHGRYDVYVHRLHGNANPSLPFVLSDVWQPQSNFELGLPLTASTTLSRHWFQWVMEVIRQYAAVTQDHSVHLVKTDDGTLLRSPLSQSMSGVALGPPVAGTTGNAAAVVFSPLPSATTVFTAEYWMLLQAQTATGVDMDDVALATWAAFLGASATLLHGRTPQFLYPPLGTIGAFACDAAGAKAASPCSIVEELSTAGLDTLMHLPATVDMVPKMQGK
ncbi:putative transmembrane protein [Leptomonas pyrrhocoris]|uniref:Putative transmembrane protein n=1 Tax=Leptomonas pyrrhocoris TaxID=157538 RepID=A0A0N0DUK6_LEPPY|nr:putative transmembrane protein [Leptomonas pyrrhocoris]KPA79068.1 putative transmembrane protein [Leptomonas pyrrhocoris]|eukprot:XP_015657507.1 putative transmembrane protein [Leptomonas pyrrhocoris]